MQRSRVDLPDPRGSDQADDLVIVDHEIDPAEDLEVAEGLADPFDVQGRRGHATPPAWSLR